MIGRIVTSEVSRAAREKATRKRPATPPHRSSGTGMAILGTLCGLAVIAAIVVPLVLHHDKQAGTLANQQTCSDVWQWTAGYDAGLADEIGPASLTPDPELRADVASLLGDVQDAQIVNDAVVPSQQIKADVSALLGRCDQLGLNPGGSDGASVP